MRGFHNPVGLDMNSLLFLVASQGKVTRGEVSSSYPWNTGGQVAYGLDKLHTLGKVRRYRDKGGRFIYAFKHF